MYSTVLNSQFIWSLLKYFYSLTKVSSHELQTFEVQYYYL